MSSNDDALAADGQAPTADDPAADVTEAVRSIAAWRNGAQPPEELNRAARPGSVQVAMRPPHVRPDAQAQMPQSK